MINTNDESKPAKIWICQSFPRRKLPTFSKQSSKPCIWKWCHDLPPIKQNLMGLPPHWFVYTDAGFDNMKHHSFQHVMLLLLFLSIIVLFRVHDSRHRKPNSWCLFQTRSCAMQQIAWTNSNSIYLACLT